nr:PREDICTED: nucleoside diphosphate-linked moiety X motif 8 [Bemisia tabaci]
MAFLARLNVLLSEPLTLPVDTFKSGLCIKLFSSFSADGFLKEESKKACVDRFQKISHVFPRPPADKPLQKAAVLVPICRLEDELALLYTLRAIGVNRHRGQVSFPGGMFDESDHSLEQTAVRETNEELGIRKDQIEIWGKGNTFDVRGIEVTPVLGYVGAVDLDKLSINKSEVELAFLVSVRHLCDPVNFRYTQFKDGYSSPVYLKAKCRIWGITGVITHFFLKALCPEQYKNSLYFLKPIQR